MNGFWHQLAVFIQKTQNKALEIQEGYQTKKVHFSHPKKFTIHEKEHIQKHLATIPYPSIDLVVQNPAGDEDALRTFVQHLTDDTALQQKIHLHVLSPKKMATYHGQSGHVHRIPQEGFTAAINSVAQQSSADWLLVCHADDTLLRMGWNPLPWHCAVPRGWMQPIQTRF